MGYSKGNRRKGNVIKNRKPRGGSRSSSNSSTQASSGWYLFSPRSGLPAILTASLLVALTSLAYTHRRLHVEGQQEATRIRSTEPRGDAMVTESNLEGSSAATKRGFQSNHEAFTVLHGLKTTTEGGSTMPEGGPEGGKVETNLNNSGEDWGHGGLRKPRTLAKQAVLDGGYDMFEGATEEELIAERSQEMGWMSSLKNLVLGRFSRASESVKEPLAMEDAVIGPVGEVDREDDRSAVGGAVPEWVRPSKRELEDIVRAQFGPWRSLSDASPEAFANGSVGATKGGCSPMQQGMAPYQEDHLYRCYAQMRQDYEFGAPLRQVAVVTMGEDKAVKASPRGVVTFMSTSQPSDLNNLKKALRALSINLLDEHPYPVAIIHEDFSTELMKKLGHIVPVPIHFVEVEFKLPDWIEPLSWIYPLAIKHYTGHPNSIPLVGFHSDMHGLLPYVKRGSFGYFHMCRFFGGAGYMLPFFDNFDLYLRLDSDSFCSQRLPDYFMKLEKTGADYAYDSTFLDFGDKAQGLWNFAEKYMQDRNISPTFWKRPKPGGQIAKVLAKANERAPYPKCSNQSPQKEKIVSIQGTKIHPVPCQDRHFQAVPAFYTNFEVARIKMLRSSWYQDWFNAIDKSGSIFYNRWGDAPIRFIGLSMYLPEDKIIRVSGCHHD